MNLILKDILTSAWLLHDERKDAYAALLLSLLNGDAPAIDTSEARRKNHAYVISSPKAMLVDADSSMGLRNPNIEPGSIAVIPIRDEIMKYDQSCGPRGTMSILEDLRLAEDNANIKSILLVVDSPGGQVTYTDILAAAVKNCAKPVIGYVEGMAASAAYWIVSGCTRIIASSGLDRIGSIGTMLYYADLQPYYEEMGVKFHEIYATKSPEKNKDINDVLDGKYEGYRKEVLDIINENFHTAVKMARPNINREALTGKIFFASDAISMGLIDEIGSMEYALSQADVPEQTNVTINPPQGDPEGGSQDPDGDSKNKPMKISEKWNAIMAILFKGEGEKPEELNEESIDQVNARLEEQQAQITSLTSQYEDERAARVQLEEDLTAVKSTLAETERQFEALKDQDAGKESGAKKEGDRIEGEQNAPVYAHDRIADRFTGKK